VRGFGVVDCAREQKDGPKPAFLDLLNKRNSGMPTGLNGNIVNTGLTRGCGSELWR
jgi:hypothetical protein